MNKKIILSISIIFVLAIVGLTTWTLVDIFLPPRFEIKDGKLFISDTWKKEIDLTDAEITMSSEKLELTNRVAGTSIGDLRKGKFNLKDIDGVVYLSMMKLKEDYIFIKKGEERFYINLKTSTETLDLYNKLINAQQQ